MRTKQRLLYFIAHPEFYETVDAYVPDEQYYIDVVRKRLPSDWSGSRSGPWFHCNPPDHRHPAQGWKIHLSATIEYSRQVLLAALPLLIERRISFKFAVDARILHLLNSKRWSRGHSGKFITIYPHSEAEFLELLPVLDAATSAYAGPYILSDRRYRDSRVVYYRYGTFRRPFRCNVMGQRVSYLTAPDGTSVIDARSPYFELPPWVADPVSPAAEPPPERISLKDGRYQVVSVLGFTNAGGVYLAHDAECNRQVVLKEARPYVGVGPSASDSVKLLTREHRLLTELADLAVGPLPYDLFTEWEHTFLVEEYIAGRTLRMHGVHRFPLFRTAPSAESIETFRDNAIAIFETLAAKLHALHERGIVFTDLSPNNVVIRDDQLDVRLIDFEGAFKAEEGTPVDFYTPGFVPRGAGPHEQACRERDLYSLGAVMLSYLFPISGLFDLKPSGRDEWLLSLTQDLRLPPEIPACIQALMSDEVSRRPSAGEVSTAMGLVRCRLDGQRLRPAAPAPAAHALPQPDAAADAGALASRALAFISSVADPRRQDRLWPSDPLVFRTNPLSVAYGACGVAYVLHRAGACPPYVLEWISKCRLSHDSYPGGLYVGLAGVAWSLLELGLERPAEEALDLASEHPMLWDSPDLFYGAAGWGMANLKFFARTGDPKYLRRAREAGERILALAIEEDDTCYWRSVDQVYFGLAHGASGIALFFLYLYLASLEERWYEAGRRALEFDLRHAVEAPRGGLAWPYHTERGNTILPYWKYGSAGVGTALLRYQQISHSSRWQTTLGGIVDFLECKYAVGAGQCMGLAGLGNFLIDCHRFTGDSRYMDGAQRTLQGIRLFAIDKGEGLAFPGDGLGRISCDYATGTAGVALFLWRMAHGGEAAFMLDDLLGAGASRRSVA